MSYVVSITSQGQISIPAPIRRVLDLLAYKKAFVTQENGRVIIEPIKDILTQRGSLSQYAKKDIQADKLIKMEKSAWENFYQSNPE